MSAALRLWVQYRLAVVSALAAVLWLLTGCATTVYTFEASVGANVTKHMSGAGYGGGFDGPRDVVQFAVQAQQGRGFCEFRHLSHLSAGAPFNDRREDFVDMLSCGVRLRRGGQ